MTAVTSPKDLISAYRTKARQDALAKGAPTNRSAFPGLSLEPTGMIFLRGKKAIYKPTTDTAQTLDADLLIELLTRKDASTVVADHATYNKLLVIADNLPSTDNKGRRLRIAEGPAWQHRPHHRGMGRRRRLRRRPGGTPERARGGGQGQVQGTEGSL